MEKRIEIFRLALTQKNDENRFADRYHLLPENPVRQRQKQIHWMHEIWIQNLSMLGGNVILPLKKNRQIFFRNGPTPILLPFRALTMNETILTLIFPNRGSNHQRNQQIFVPNVPIPLSNVS